MRTSNAKNHKWSAKGSIFLKTTVQSFAPLEVITLYDTGSANNIKWKNMLSCVYIYIYFVALVTIRYSQNLIHTTG